MSTDYILQKLDELTNTVEAQKRRIRELEEMVGDHQSFTGYDTFASPPGTRHGDLAGHQLGLIGRVRHLEHETGVEWDALPDEAKERFEDAGFHGDVKVPS